MDDEPDRTEALKRRIRAEVRARRRGMGERDRAAARDGLTRQLIGLVEAHGARSLTCYASIPGEPDTSAFLAWAAERGIEVLLPVTRPGGAMDWVRAGGGFSEGPFGIPQPLGEPADPARLARLDLVLAPACAVDRSGTRLGWGGGYFDRFLAGLAHRPPVHALVHEAEFVAELPRETHDVPVAGVVTPERAVRIPRGTP
ncbi:MAG: 5-formyltetrahydrofolate cyclo-ligase [Leucobacter sp.]